MVDSKEHWDNIYNNREPEDVGWYQLKPEVSLGLIEKANRKASDRIIDIGSGTSTLVDCLLEKSYQEISMLDISTKALERTKIRLGSKADSINWLVDDLKQFKKVEPASKQPHYKGHDA